jgi:hypothetical protein
MLRPATIVAAGLFGMAIISNSAVAANNDQITICHVPPGNPANAHRITVDDSALPAHLAHGDIQFGGPTATFTFWSGAATANYDPSGLGPRASGTGSYLALDPITTIGGATSNAGFSLPPNPKTLTLNGGATPCPNPAWSVLPGTAWVSYTDTCGGDPSGTPPNTTTITFDAPFTVPYMAACAITPTLTVQAFADDSVSMKLNGHVLTLPAPLHTAGSGNVDYKGNAQSAIAVDPTWFAPNGHNLLEFSVEQQFGVAFGLDYLVNITLH